MDHVQEADARAMVRGEDNIISPWAMDPKNWRLHGPVNQEGGSSQPPVRRVPPPASDSEGKYQCTKCPRKFPTPQSLGGHMSSHGKANRVAEAQQCVDGLTVAPAVDNIMAPTVAPAPLAAATVDLTIAPAPLAAAAVDLTIAPAPLAAAAIDLTIAPAPQAAAAIDLNIALAPPAAAAVVLPAAPNPNGVPRDFDLNVEIPWE